jgi:hypothetical protein
VHPPPSRYPRKDVLTATHSPQGSTAAPVPFHQVTTAELQQRQRSVTTHNSNTGNSRTHGCTTAHSRSYRICSCCHEELVNWSAQNGRGCCGCCSIMCPSRMMSSKSKSSSSSPGR